MDPYTDENTTRTFSKDVDAMSLIWHTDQEDRTSNSIRRQRMATPARQ